MKKEIVISIIIVFLVVISDFFTSNITDNRINDNRKEKRVKSWYVVLFDKMDY